MLLELGIKHRYTRPYRPQTNGKVERFWRTLDEDVIDGATFDNLDHFANELFDYLIYYNNYRPHQALGGQTPKAGRRRQNSNHSISELVNIYNCERSEAIQVFPRRDSGLLRRCAPRNDGGDGRVVRQTPLRSPCNDVFYIIVHAPDITYKL